MKAAEMIAFANDRIDKALAYGPDMAGPKAMIINDANVMIEMAIAKADAEENPPQFDGDVRAFLDGLRKRAMIAKRAYAWVDGLEIIALYAAGAINWYANGIKFGLGELERQLAAI